MHQQMRDFLEFAVACEIEDVVAPVGQIVAAAADAAKRGVAGDNTRERNGFFRRWF